MNGHVLEYTTLSGSGRINGGVPGGYGHGALMPQGCHHLHHKLPNGLTLLNGGGSLYSRGHDGALPHGNRDCEHPHPHHHHNVSATAPTVAKVGGFSDLNFSLSCRQGGGMYTALPQTESSDCMSCQNLCNNNRYRAITAFRTRRHGNPTAWDPFHDIVCLSNDKNCAGYHLNAFRRVC